MTDHNHEPIRIEALQRQEALARKTARHPCFNADAHGFARLHLPVAPKCNIQCNYCSRKFDCVNESRPGVTSQVLTPQEAAARFVEVKAAMPNLTVVGISGPGDPLANIRPVLETIGIVHALDPEVTFCLSTNGLELPRYAADLVEAGVTHFTVTMNAMDPAIGARIYRFVGNEGGAALTGEQAALLLMQRQLDGIAMLSRMGVALKINIVAIKGVNDSHIHSVVSRVKGYQPSAVNITPLIPVAGTPFSGFSGPSAAELAAIRKSCGEVVPQISHCKQCRADAIGMLGQDVSLERFSCEKGCNKKNIG